LAYLNQAIPNTPSDASQLVSSIGFDDHDLKDFSKPPKTITHNPLRVSVQVSAVEDEAVAGLVISSDCAVVRRYKWSSEHPMQSRRAQPMLQYGVLGLNDSKPVASNSKAELVIDIVHEKGFVEAPAIRENRPLSQSA
jgi:hypothetical protein